MESDKCISSLVYFKKIIKWRLQVKCSVLLSNVGYVEKESVGCL